MKLAFSSSHSAAGFSIAAVILATIGCGAPGAPVPAGPDSLSIDIADSIGLELGDSGYVFGSIDRLCHLRDGSILALDRVGCCLRRFGSDGAFIERVGTRGSGPGEYLNPSDMAVLGDGRVIVCDIFTGGVHLLDTALVDQGVRIPFYSDPPFFPEGGPDSSFVAATYVMEVENDLVTIDYMVGRFDMQPDPTVVYYEERIPIDPQDVTGIVDALLRTACWTVDGEGNVLVAEQSTDVYEVTGFRPDGTRYLTIEREVDRVPKSQEEMDLEEAYIEAKMTSMGSSLPPDYHPSAWRTQIRELHADGEGRIWVLRGTETVPTFDVYDGGGNLLFTATVPGAGDNGLYWRFAIDAHGMLAWSEDPEDFARIFVLEPGVQPD